MYIYESLADEIAMSITRGQLKPGMRLPSVRKLANMRSVSINTVKAAYCLLEDRGLINPRPQSGYFVSNKLPLLKGSQQPPVHENVPLSGINRLLAVILNYQRKEGYVDLALACPSGAAFYPTYRLRKLTAQVLRAGNHTQDVYVMPPGSARLRSQIARRGLQQGMVLSAQDILITHGTMEALNLAVRASTQPGDTVALETPTFYNLYPMIEEIGRAHV